jgi:hypothetical protein
MTMSLRAHSAKQSPVKQVNLIERFSLLVRGLLRRSLAFAPRNDMALKGTK